MAQAATNVTAVGAAQASVAATRRVPRRRRVWHSALLATTALIAVGLAMPERAAADTIIPSGLTTLVSPSINEPGKLDVIGTLNLVGPGTVEVSGVTTVFAPALPGDGALIMDGGMLFDALGGLVSRGTISLLDGFLSVDETTTLHSGSSLSVSGSSIFVSLGSMAMLGNATVSVQEDGTFDAQGGLTLSGFAALTVGGSAVANFHDALVLEDDSSITINSGSSVVFGTTEVKDSASILVAGGSFHVNETVTLAGGTIEIGASGTMTAEGGLAGSDGTDDTLLVAGTFNVTGNVAFGTGNDTFAIAARATVTAGTIFDGGDGSDTLRLTGTGSRAEDMTRFPNFEKIEMQGTGTWTLTGGTPSAPTTVQSITVDTGSLVLLGIWKATGNTTSVASESKLTIGDGGTQSALAEDGDLNVRGRFEVTAGGAVTVLGTTTVFPSLQVGSSVLPSEISVTGTMTSGTTIVQGGESEDGLQPGRLRILAGGSYQTLGITSIASGEIATLGGTYEGIGQVTLTGAGRITLNPGTSSIFLARSGLSVSEHSRINVFQASHFDVAGPVTVREEASITVSGGTFTARDTTTVSDTAEIHVREQATYRAMGAVSIQGDALLRIRTDSSLIADDTTTIANSAVLLFEGNGHLVAGGPLRSTGGWIAAGPENEVRGVLRPGGTITGSLLNDGGTVGGYSVLLAARGVPDPDLGVLKVVGSYNQGPGGTLLAGVRLSADSQASDLLLVEGTTHLAGTVSVVTFDGPFPVGYFARLVRADRPIEGMFASATLEGVPIGDVTAVVLKRTDGGEISPDGNNIDLVFVSPGVAANGLSGNKKVIAASLGKALPEGGIVVYDDTVATALAASAAPQTLDQLSPEPYDSFTAFSFEVARIFGGLVDSRVRGLRDGGSGIGTPGLFASDRRDPVLIADTGGTPGGVARPKAPGDYSNGIGPRPSGWSVWASGIGSGLWLDQSAGNLGYSGWTAGGAAGVDLRLAKGFVVGVLAGGSRSNIDFDGVSGDGDMDSVTTGVYAAWVGKHLFANTAFTYTKNWVEADRDITAMGATANGKTEGDQYAVHATVGVGFRLKRLSIEASGGVDWVTLKQKGFTETGAGALNLTVDSRSDNSLRLRAGIRLATAVRVRPGFVLVPSARVGYARELMDTTRPITATLAGVGGAFTVTGDEGGRDFVTYGGGIQAKWSQGLTLYFDYAGEWATDRTASTFSGGVKVSW